MTDKEKKIADNLSILLEFSFLKSQIEFCKKTKNPPTESQKILVSRIVGNIVNTLRHSRNK